MAAIPAIGPFLRDLYYSTYVLFFRMSFWKSPAREGLSVGAVSVVKSFVILGLISWYEIFASHRFRIEDWGAALLFLVLYVGDFWFLILKGGGEKFEKNFDKLPKERRIFLRLSALGLVLASIAFGLWSIVVYRKAFGIQ